MHAMPVPAKKATNPSRLFPTPLRARETTTQNPIPVDTSSLAKGELEESSLSASLARDFQILDWESGEFWCKNPASLLKRVARLKAQGTRIIAVRHGESVANQKGHTLSGKGDTPLTSKGREQAAEAAKKLGETIPDPKDLVIYSSPLSRAADTAAALKKLHPEAEFQLDQDLEEIDFGRCEGRPVKEVVQSYPGFASGTDFVHRFPGGESGFDVMNRMDRFLSKVENDCPGKTVVFFAHTMTVGVSKLLLGQFETQDNGAIKIDRRIPNATPQSLV